MSGTFLGTGLGGGFFPAAAAASPVTPPAPTSEAVAAGGSVTSWTFSAFTDPDSRIASYSATLTAVVGSGSLSGTGLGPYSLTGTADGDSYTVELDALDGDGAILATATHSVAIASGGIVAGSFITSGYIELDGVDERVNLGNVPAMEMATGSPYSISLWVLSFGTNNMFFGIDSTTNADNKKYIYEASNGQLILNLKLGGQQYAKYKSGVVPEGQWAHLIVTSDGTDYRAWVDGAEITAWSSVSGTYPTATETWDGTAEVWIGCAATALAFHTDGQITQVAMWSTDQAANVAAIYALDRTGDMRTLGTPPDLLYVPFKVYGDSETTANGISDLSGNNYDGSGTNLDGDELRAHIGDLA